MYRHRTNARGVGVDSQFCQANQCASLRGSEPAKLRLRGVLVFPLPYCFVYCIDCIDYTVLVNRDLIPVLNVCECFAYWSVPYMDVNVWKVFLHTDCHNSLDIVYLLFWLPPCPCTLYYCLTVKQAYGNLGLLAGYGAKPIGAGLGRDRVVSEWYLPRVIPHTHVQMSYRMS